MTAAQIRAEIRKAFERHLDVDPADASAIVGAINGAGKLYEALVLGEVARRLTVVEGCKINLTTGNILRLKAKGGPINPAYGTISVSKRGTPIGELWTDVEFLGLSFHQRGSRQHPTAGDFHELDIVMTEPGTTGRPSHERVMIAVECKNTTYQKRHLREILGVRRELSFLRPPTETSFAKWPATHVPANPCSCLLVFSSDAAVNRFDSSGPFFGIQFYYLPAW